MITLSPAQGAEYLKRYELPMVNQRLVKTLDEALEAAAVVGYPVALKLITSKFSHKSDINGIRLDIANGPELQTAVNELLEIACYYDDGEARLLIQPMVSGLAEIIIGINLDPTFGQVIVVGLGGTLTELFQDIAVAVCPITETIAWEMLAELRSAKLLDGFRGKPAADKKSIIDLMIKVSKLAADPDLLELDLNPVIVHTEGNGCTVVDNRLVLRNGLV